MDHQQLYRDIENTWDEHILPSLKDYVAIPNKSPAFDANWAEHGYMQQAVDHLVDWAQRQNLRGASIDVLQLPNRTPVILIDIEGTHPEQPILLYGHLDKQPEMEGWRPPFSPWQPVIDGNRLYGRGAADDGYALYSALNAVQALQHQHIVHPRCLILIEASEESGSVDLPAYIEAYRHRLATPKLIICLDSSCGNYDQLWTTTSLRGILTGMLRVDLLQEGVHSGRGSGIFASSFRVMRQLLSRIEEESTGEILLSELNPEIPARRIEEAKAAAEVLQDSVYTEFSYHEGVQPITTDRAELILNRTWRPSLCITGARGLPSSDNAGNVLRPYTELKLSLRLPPTCSAKSVAQTLKKTLESSPPYGARVHFQVESAEDGWEAPTTAPWLQQAAENASMRFFGASAMATGEGGSIPFMGMLGKQFPQAQFLITGVLGPHSNAHGPNEFLEMDTAKKVTACVAEIIFQYTVLERSS